MPDELFSSSFQSQFYTTKYKLDSFRNSEDGNLQTFCYLLTRKVIEDKKLKELLDRQIVPENPNESFKEIQEQIHSLCGDIYFSKNRFGAAIEQYDLCLDYNPGNIHATVGLANSFQSLGLDGLARGKYKKSKDFYAWEKTFLDKNVVEEQNSSQDNHDDAGSNEFQYIPKGLLFNMAIVEEDKEKSERMFQYLEYSEPAPDFNETYVFVEFGEFYNERNPAHFRNADTCAKLEKGFPEIKIDYLRQNKINLDSKNYKVYSKRISTFTMYIAVPENIIKSKKISALYFQYSLKKFNDVKILQNILEKSNIKIEYNKKMDKSERKILDKETFKLWLESVGYKKSLLSMKKLDDTNPRQIINETIKTYQIIKALNQQWYEFKDNFCVHIEKNSAKILIESLEDYVQLHNLNPNVQSQTKIKFTVDEQGVSDVQTMKKLLNNFKIRMEELLSNWQYDQKNVPKDKKSSESFNEYPTLIERIDKLQRQI